MTDGQTLRWCPGCAQKTQTAPLPQLSEDTQLSRTVRPGDVTEGFFRQNYCTACGHIWSSVELPSAYLEELLKLEGELEEQRRQVAMLKFLLANERQSRSEVGREVARTAPGTLRIPQRRSAA